MVTELVSSISPLESAVDSSGDVYVADTGNDRIEKFTSTGTFILQWGSNGTGPGQFNRPWGVAVDSSGNVYVTDTGNSRVEKFTGSGSFISQWGTQGPAQDSSASSAQWELPLILLATCMWWILSTSRREVHELRQLPYAVWIS